MKHILNLVIALLFSNAIIAQTQMNWFSDVTICETSDTTISFPTDVIADSTFTWMYNGIAFTPNLDNSITISEEGEYSLFIFNSGPDTLTDSFILNVDSESSDYLLTMTDSELNVDSLIDICLEDSPTLITLEENYTHFWYIDGLPIGDDTLSENSLLVEDIIDEINFNQEHVYSVEVENACGIIPAKNSIRLIVNECNCSLDMPNVFTPNGDEYNNLFKPYNNHELETDAEDMCKSTDFNMEVYSQWGRHIATINSGDEYPSWDGLNKRGKEVAPGVYFYRIVYQVNIYTLPEEKEITGFVHLYR